MENVEGFDNFEQWLIHGSQWLILGLTGLFCLFTFETNRQIANDNGINVGLQVIAVGIQIYVMIFTLFLIFKILRIIVL